MSMAARGITPAHPPLPTISKRLFQFEGSFTANRASGQIMPRMSQCSGRLPVAPISLADSILTSVPNGVSASVSHFLTGAAKAQLEASNRASAAHFMTRYLISETNWHVRFDFEISRRYD